MLKGMTVLLIVLWGSQGMPTTTRSQKQDPQGLIRLYCKAEELLQDYKSDDKKFLAHQSRSDMASVFSKPGCNFTKSAEECQILRAFQALFVWLQSSYTEEPLLTPVMNSFNLLIKLQESHVSHACKETASDKVPQITCPKYHSGKPQLENNFHFIFELYRNHTDELWRSKLSEKQRNVTEVCGTKV